MLYYGIEGVSIAVWESLWFLSIFHSTNFLFHSQNFISNSINSILFICNWKQAKQYFNFLVSNFKRNNSKLLKGFELYVLKYCSFVTKKVSKKLYCRRSPLGALPSLIFYLLGEKARTYLRTHFKAVGIHLGVLSDKCRLKFDAGNYVLTRV